MKVIEFISTFEHYLAESNGIKPYTIRRLTNRLKKRLHNATHVRIRKGYTNQSFSKTITHKLEWDKWIILAWHPDELLHTF